jgi:anti-sigma regulatory factor (Ser/Thr protein kinase)
VRFGPCLKEVYPAVAGSVPLIRNGLASFGESIGLDRSQVDRLRLAISEAVTNVVLYAYPSRIGYVHVTARVAADELWVLITDNGSGFHAEREGNGLGLGLAVISQVTDGFAVLERSSGGTELRLLFDLAA